MAKVALIILDGFGITPETKGNAILSAKTPNLDMIYPLFPKALLKASAEEVGLHWGEFGSSEVGHTTIGLGRIVLQNLPQISLSLENKTFEKKPLFTEMLKMIDNGSAVNIIFVLSDGGVHGFMDHAISIIDLIKAKRPKAVIKLHLITDGRDTAEKSAEMYLKELNKRCNKKFVVSSLMGRFYAMDRDKNWDRTKLAYNAILGTGKHASSAEEAIKESYQNDKTDEFIEPYSFTENKADIAKDIFIFTNFRTDRALQLSRAFVDPSLTELKRSATTNYFYTMTTYDDNLGLKVLFTNLDLNDAQTNTLSNPLVKVISSSGKTQFHVAETEKYAHITYFFAGGAKQEFSGQKNCLVQSKRLASYDIFPQMRVAEITQEILNASEQQYDFIVANLANGDMVGHSGNFAAAQKAVSIMDYYLGKLLGPLLRRQYSVFITADHGNCDEMIDFNSGKPNKEHTLNPVPFVCCDLRRKGKYLSKIDFFSSEPIGLLADISPTLLEYLQISKPTEMSGMSIINQMK